MKLLWKVLWGILVLADSFLFIWAFHSQHTMLSVVGFALAVLLRYFQQAWGNTTVARGTGEI